MAWEEAAVSIGDAGFLLGWGAFETVRVHRGRALFLRDHLERLTRALAALRLGPPPPSLPATVRRLIAANGADEAALRITCTAGPVSPERPAGSPPRPTVFLSLRRVPRRPRPFRLARTPYVVHPGDPLAGIKTTARPAYAMALLWARLRGCHEGLLRTPSGDWAEGSFSNIFCVLDGTLVTPPLDRGILPGLVRERILRACRERGIPVREAHIRDHDLERAEEILLTSSVRGITPVDALRGRRRRLPGARGPHARRLGAIHAELVALELARLGRGRS
jgi:branched-subunit amino acid aminotransferase/4-amino-4-deoxychorismate lyase